MATIIGLNPATLIPVNILISNNRQQSELCYIKGKEDKFYVRKIFEYKNLYDIENVINDIELEFTFTYKLSQQKDFPNNLSKYIGYYCDKKHIMIAREYMIGNKIHTICSKTHSLNSETIFSYSLDLLNSSKYIYNNLINFYHSIFNSKKYDECLNLNIHYDNVFFKDIKAYITDWGLNILNISVNRTGNARRDAFLYNDPYLFKYGCYAGFKSVIYSVGVIIFTLITNKIYKVKRFQPIDILKEYQNHKAIIFQMINDNPDNRCNLEQIETYTKAIKLNII
jgi:hypothetical protein